MRNDNVVIPDRYLLSVWNPVNGSLLQTLLGHTDWVSYLAVLPDNYLASASRDKTIKIWNTLNGKLLKTFYAESKVRSLTVLSDKTLAGASDDGLIRILGFNRKFNRTKKPIWS